MTYSRETLDLLEGLDRTASADELMHRMERILSRFGFEFSCLTSFPAVHQRFEDVMLAIRVPPEWLKLYIKEQYVQIDPTIRHCRRTSHPFEWRSAPYDPDKEPRAAEMVRRATDFGLAEGLWIPIFGRSGCEGGVWMGGRHPDRSSGTRLLLHLVALYAFDRLRSLRRQPVERRSNLTKREREVLTWIVSGKSDWEIGQILAISKRTVENHARATLRKLGAANRPHAVAVALRERIITL